MTSEVEICKLALSMIRGGNLNSFADGSLQAQQCQLWYPQVRDFMQRDAPWNFTRKIDALAVLGDEDIFNWVYVYAYPNDCLYIERLILNYEEFGSVDGAIRTRQLEDIYAPDLGAQVKYDVHNVGDPNGKVIVANEPDLRIEYRARVTDPNKFDPMFIEAMAALLASKMAIPIVGGEQGMALRKDSLQLYNLFMDNAIAANRNESYTEPLDSDFVTVRR